jgi:hypothetical protein
MIRSCASVKSISVSPFSARHAPPQQIIRHSREKRESRTATFRQSPWDPRERGCNPIRLFLHDVSSGDVLNQRMCRLGVFASAIGPGPP